MVAGTDKKNALFFACLLGIVLGKELSGKEKGAGINTEPLVFIIGSPTGS